MAGISHRYIKMLPPRFKAPARVLRHPIRHSERKRFERAGYRNIARKGLKLTEAAFGHAATGGRGDLGYQDLYGLGRSDGSRSTLDRWELIEQHLPLQGSALDIGSQNGWFVFRMAERGLVALGVEYEESCVRTAELLSLYNRSERAAFVRMEVTAESASHLPTADVVLALSVFHHFVRLQGLEYATEVMQGLAARARTDFFFETGQYNERHGEHGRRVGESWWGPLAFMEDDPRPWTKEFLLSLGFSQVQVLGSTLAPRSHIERYLFRASR